MSPQEYHKQVEEYGKTHNLGQKEPTPMPGDDYKHSDKHKKYNCLNSWQHCNKCCCNNTIQRYLAIHSLAATYNKPAIATTQQQATNWLYSTTSLILEWDIFITTQRSNI